MDNTANFGFGMPLGGENYDVEVQNDNWTAADTVLKNHQDRIEVLEPAGVIGAVTALGLATNFAAYGLGFAAPAYITSHGGKRIDLQGVVKRSAGGDLAFTTSSFSFLETLPVGIRPPTNQTFLGASGLGNSGLAALITVNSTGTVLVTFSSSGTWRVNNNSDYVSLSGIGWWKP